MFFHICVNYEKDFKMSIQVTILIGLIITALVLIKNIKYENVRSKLPVIGKVNAFVLSISSALIAFVNNAEQGKDYFSAQYDAGITSILLLPFVSAIIFFQYYLSEADKNYNWLKVAFLGLYLSTFAVLYFFYFCNYKHFVGKLKISCVK